MVTRFYDSLMTTCGEACWHAKEDVCRCSCSGKNHGILKRDGQEQPARTRRIGYARLRLVAVFPTHRGAVDYIKGAGQFYCYHSPRDAVQVVDRRWYDHQGIKDLGMGSERATDAQLKWPEVVNIWEASGRGSSRPYLVWQRGESPVIETERHGQKEHTQEESAMMGLEQQSNLGAGFETEEQLKMALGGDHAAYLSPRGDEEHLKARAKVLEMLDMGQQDMFNTITSEEN